MNDLVFSNDTTSIISSDEEELLRKLILDHDESDFSCRTLQLDWLSQTERFKAFNKPKRKKKCGRKPTQRPQYIPSLRIYKSDIRRKYPDMYVNVMNSLDPALVKDFFGKYCSPELIYERKDGSCPFSKMFQVLVPRPIVGAPPFVAASAAFVTQPIFSDIHLKLENPQLFVRQGELGSRIVARNFIRITLLYSLRRIPSSEKESKENQLLPSPSYEFLDPVADEYVSLTLLPEPIPMAVSYSLTISLNERHEINKLQFLHLDTISLTGK